MYVNGFSNRYSYNFLSRFYPFIFSDKFTLLFLDAVLMWTAPPPAWNQTEPGTDTASIQTAVIQVLNGSSNVSVRWNYANFHSRFSIHSTSEFSTLTINKVSERENATFQRRLHVGTKIWAYNIRVEVTGRFRERSPLGGIRPHRCKR